MKRLDFVTATLDIWVAAVKLLRNATIRRGHALAEVFATTIQVYADVQNHGKASYAGMFTFVLMTEANVSMEESAMLHFHGSIAVVQILSLLGQPVSITRIVPSLVTRMVECVMKIPESAAV